jgi:transglutaminase-like putative cysteine protease
VPKAVLLTAAARAVGIPARLGFADVRNHLQTPRLRERMGGTDEFVYHGYSDLLLDGRWVKATPAFNKELCARFGVAPIDFDGRTDALLHPFTADGSAYMTYGRDRGVHVDLPLDDLLATFDATYGPGMTRPSRSGAAQDEFTAPT